MNLRSYKFSIKLGTRERSDFSVSISVNNEGLFTTLLPEDVTEQFKKANIPVHFGRSKTKAYYHETSFQGLVQKIKDDISVFESVERLSEEIIIRYRVDTICSYCKSKGDSGEIVPNGYMVDASYTGNKWFKGSVDTNATYRKMYGLNMFVRVYNRITYSRSDGKVFSEYEFLPNFFKDPERPNLTYLYNMTCMPDEREYHEIVYTEERAQFFVDMFKWICTISERITDFMNPESLQKAIDNGVNLLGGPDGTI
jgi:hypothetical protein